MATTKSKKQKTVTLACSGCGNRNYATAKTTAMAQDRMALKKYCSHCQAHTEHLETK